MNNSYLYVYLIFLFSFFTPDYGLNSDSSILNLILPYVKHYFVSILIILYFISLLLQSKSIYFRYRNDSLYSLLVIIFGLYILHIYNYTVNANSNDAFSITTFLVPFFILNIYNRGADFKFILNSFISAYNILIVLMFFEIIIFQFLHIMVHSQVFLFKTYRLSQFFQI